MTVTELVASQLAVEAVEAVPDGFGITRNGDRTEITFRPADGAEATMVATITTLFGADLLPGGDASVIARLNRRAVHGCFSAADSDGGTRGGIGCRLTYPLRDRENDAASIAQHLVTAFQEQQSVGRGVARIEVSRDSAAEIRDASRRPRAWRAPVADDVFKDIVLTRLQQGGIAYPGRADIQIPLPMDDPSGRASLDPRETAWLRVSAGVPHPVAGPGYLALLSLPPLAPGVADDTWCRVLNGREQTPDRPLPSLGAWSLRGAGYDLVYGLFLPATEGSRATIEQIIRWMTARAEWIARTFWMPGFGLIIREGTAR